MNIADHFEPAVPQTLQNPAGAAALHEDITGRSIVKYFLWGLSLVAVSDVPIDWGMAFYAAQALLASLIIATIILPPHKALLLVFMLTVAGQDIVSAANSSESFATASIWQMRVGSINPSWLMFACLFIQLLKAAPLSIPVRIKKVMFLFATVPVITGLAYGGFLTENASVEVLIDLKFPLMLFMSMILFHSMLRKRQGYLQTVLAAFIGVLLARHMVDLVYFLFNWGPAIAEGVSRVSEDSGKGGVVFLVFFGLMLSWRSGVLDRDRKKGGLYRRDGLRSSFRRLFLGPAIALPAVLLLAAYGTRLLWITFAVGALVLLSILKSRRSAVVLVLLVVGGVSGLWALSVINPNSAQIILVRFKTITEGRSFDGPDAIGVEYNLVSRIDPVRYAETLNILDSTHDRLSYLWGSGYGGYYEDKVANFPHNLQTAFAQYSFDSGKFYRAHDYFMHTFLKFGLIGLAIISMLWIAPGFALFGLFRSREMFSVDQPLMLHGTILCVVAFLATAMLQLYWSGKGLFINGMIIASCMEFARRKRA